MPIAGWVIIGIVVVILLFFAGTYNSLIRLRNQVKNAWAQIDVQLKRRHDLIPNLVETVKGYAAHERETLESVTNARNLAQGAIGKGVGAQSKAEADLSGALSKLLAVVNNKTQMFPSNIIASITRFQAGEFFEVEAPAEREVPKVSFT
jgi:LemA protein